MQRGIGLRGVWCCPSRRLRYTAPIIVVVAHVGEDTAAGVDIYGLGWRRWCRPARECCPWEGVDKKVLIWSCPCRLGRGGVPQLPCCDVNTRRLAVACCGTYSGGTGVQCFNGK